MLCALLAACGSQEEPAPTELPSQSAPLRVASLSPAATAFVVELGAASTLVAIDPESARLPGVTGLPVASLEDAPELQPDLVLLGAIGPEDGPALERLRARGAEVVTVAPRDYDEVFALYRGLGARLAGPARSAVLEAGIGRELGALASESRGLRRPRVAAVRSVEPFDPAPAHGFETDLIELAGGTSIAHDREQRPPPASPAELADTEPELVLVVSPVLPPESAREAARETLGSAGRVEFFVLDWKRFWVRDGVDAVRRLRALIDPLR